MIMGAVALFLVTSLVGRVWCGYTCPQTVWTDLFMWVERLIEGDRNERMKRDAQPTSFGKVWRKSLKHATWLGIAFWTGGAWIMYFVDAPTVTVEFWTGTASKEVYFFTFLFTATTYRPRRLGARAGVHLHVPLAALPGGDAGRAEPDRHLPVLARRTTHARQASGGQQGRRLRRLRRLRHRVPDRDRHPRRHPVGMHQLRPVHRRLQPRDGQAGQAPWLITWDTLANQSAKARGEQAPFRFFRARTIIYLSALLLGTTVFAVTLVTHASQHLSVLHDRAPLFVRLADGSLRNGYTIKIVNKQQAPVTYELSVSGMSGAVLTEPDEGLGPAKRLGLTVGADTVGTWRVLVAASPRPHGTRFAGTGIHPA